MSLLKTILSIGAGIIAAAGSYVLMSSNKSTEVKGNVVNNPDVAPTMPSPELNKSDKVIKTLDKVQIGLVNFARFSSEIIRAVILFIRAMKCYEYDNSYQYQQYQR